MQFHDNEWLPASLCTIDSFDGSVEAFGGGGGPAPDAGGFGNANGLDASGTGIGVVDLSASPTPVDWGSVGTSLGAIAAGVAGLASAPVASAIALGVGAVQLNQQAVNGTLGVLSPDPSMAAMQLNWQFAGPQ
jgi:hypothetical protein